MFESAGIQSNVFNSAVDRAVHASAYVPAELTGWIVGTDRPPPGGRPRTFMPTGSVRRAVRRRVLAAVDQGGTDLVPVAMGKLTSDTCDQHRCLCLVLRRRGGP